MNLTTFRQGATKLTNGALRFLSDPLFASHLFRCSEVFRLSHHRSLFAKDAMQLHSEVCRLLFHQCSMQNSRNTSSSGFIRRPQPHTRLNSFHWMLLSALDFSQHRTSVAPLLFNATTAPSSSHSNSSVLDLPPTSLCRS
jgi:hypothetical protein